MTRLANSVYIVISSVTGPEDVQHLCQCPGTGGEDLLEREK